MARVREHFDRDEVVRIIEALHSTGLSPLGAERWLTRWEADSKNGLLAQRFAFSERGHLRPSTV